jgi:magnesium transporter
LTTITGGTICAIVASAYGATLAKSLVLAFFLTLVLGLGESVSMQSVTVTIHTLHLMRPTVAWYLRALWREAATAFMLGAGCGFIVGLIAWAWFGGGLAAVTIGTSIVLVIMAGALWGVSIPVLLHALKLDPKIAAGPLALALADICTIAIYFSLAMILL